MVALPRKQGSDQEKAQRICRKRISAEKEVDFSSQAFVTAFDSPSFLVVSSKSSGIRVNSSCFTLLPQQLLLDVSVGKGVDTLYKGMPFNVTWSSAGTPFPCSKSLCIPRG